MKPYTWDEGVGGDFEMAPAIQAILLKQLQEAWERVQREPAEGTVTPVPERYVFVPIREPEESPQEANIPTKGY